MMISIYSILLVLPIVCLACRDLLDNVIKIKDIGSDNSLIIFNDFTLLTYDVNRRPACSSNNKNAPALLFPGYIRISTEKDSWFVGQVCADGKSANTFVDDSKCNLNLCKLFSASSYCTMFEKEGIYSLKDMPNEFTDYIPLSASENSLLEGEWQASVAVRYNNQIVGRFRIGDSPNEWIWAGEGNREKDEL